MILSYGGLFLVLSAVNVIVGGGYIAGGYMIQAYQQSVGVHLSLLMLMISTIVGVLMLTMMPGLIDDIAEDEGLSDDEKQLEANSGLFAGVGAIFLVICNGICGLIIANTN